MSASPLRIVFAGTPDFSLPSLEAIAGSHHELLWVYTQPDAVRGRGKKLAPSPVKAFAQRHNIACEQPSKLNKVDAQSLIDHNVDVLVVVAYGQIVPPSVLAAPRFGCINVHGSSLPRWRGAAPVQRAIQAGDTTFGVCIMQMDKGLDTGPVYLDVPLGVDADTITAGELSSAMAITGAQALLQVLDDLDAYPLQDQVEEGVCYAHKVTKEEALIDWSKPATVIERHIRAFNPWPLADSFLSEQRIRIAFARAIDVQVPDSLPGTILAVDEEGVKVACGQGVLCIATMQFPGKVMQGVTSKLGLSEGAVFLNA